jgi:ornithine cyclodeaminase/alanine dehydrogenase-like protein (mu-crystallin family)
MVTKRVSPDKKTTRRKVAATAAPELTDSALISVLESAQLITAASKSVDPDFRRQLVAAEAYFLAERRGFAAGNELEDWLAAEAAVDSRLQRTQAA